MLTGNKPQLLGLKLHILPARGRGPRRESVTVERDGGEAQPLHHLLASEPLLPRAKLGEELESLYFASGGGDAG
jgi:hypothetical protein